MGRYTLYMLRSLFGSFFIISILLTSIVWITQSLRIVNLILGKGIGIVAFVKLSLLLLPSLVYMIIPIALFISVIIVFHRLYMEKELVILRGAGLNNIQIAKPAIIFSVLITILSYSISVYFLPKTYRHFKELQTFFKNRYASLLLQEGVFSTQVTGLTVYIDKRKGSNEFKGIFVHDTTDKNRIITIMAESGSIEYTSKGPQFKLVNGSQQQENLKSGKITFLFFDSYNLDLDVFYGDNGIRRYDPREMYVWDIFKSSDKTARVGGHQRLIWPLYSLVLPLICVGILLNSAYRIEELIILSPQALVYFL